MPTTRSHPIQAVVAIIRQDGKLLVIKRSQFVRAPGKICFPGGGIESGETARAALVREVNEELGIDSAPTRQIWHSHSPWKVELFWWAVSISPDAKLNIDPTEVEWAKWYSLEEMRNSSELLESNAQFFIALDNGKIDW